MNDTAYKSTDEVVLRMWADHSEKLHEIHEKRVLLTETMGRVLRRSGVLPRKEQGGHRVMGESLTVTVREEALELEQRVHPEYSGSREDHTWHVVPSPDRRRVSVPESCSAERLLEIRDDLLRLAPGRDRNDMQFRVVLVSTTTTRRLF